VKNLVDNLIITGAIEGAKKIPKFVFRDATLRDLVKKINFKDVLESEIFLETIPEIDTGAIQEFLRSEPVTTIIVELFTRKDQKIIDLEEDFVQIFISKNVPCPKNLKKKIAKDLFNILIKTCNNFFNDCLSNPEFIAIDALNEIRYKNLFRLFDESKSDFKDGLVWIENEPKPDRISRLKEILITRPIEDYYYEREHDEKIKSAIENGENVLVIGRPLSGKTRAIFEAIKNSHHNIAIPNEGENFPKIDYTQLNQKNLIIFDDLNYFAEKPSYFSKHVFFELKSNNIQIIATCRSSKVFEKTKKEMLNNKGLEISGIFGKNIIELPERVDVKIAQEIAKKLGKKWNEIKFDGTIGSIQMPFSTMEQRFKDCDRRKKSVLETTHLLHECGIYKERQIFPISWVKIICNEKYGFDPDNNELIEVLYDLNQDELLKILPDNKIWVEEVYLEDIFKPTIQISIVNIYRDMIEFFSEYPEAFFDSPEVLFRFANNAYYVIGINDRKKIKLHNLAKIVCETAIKKTTSGSIENAHFQKLLGISYRVLSEMIEENQKENAEKAISSCINASEIFREHTDFSRDYNIRVDYALCESDLGSAFRQYAQLTPIKEEKRKHCLNGIAACNKALKIKEYPKLYRGTTFIIIGVLYGILGEIEDKEKNCELGIKFCKKASRIYKEENLSIQVAHTEFIKAYNYKLLAEIKDPIINCAKAIKCLKNTFKVREIREFEIDYAWSQRYLGDTYSILSNYKDKSINLKNADKAYNEALKVFSETEFPFTRRIILVNIQEMKKNG
jgi:hypothetical protein